MKKEIVARLLGAKHITFDEALELLEVQQAVINYPVINPGITLPSQQPFPYTPWYGTSKDPYCTYTLGSISSHVN